jgi:hypothetical protein
MQAEGIISELTLLDGVSAVCVRCPEGLVPAPGRYLLAHAAGSDAPLATSLFGAGTISGGFLTADSVPSTWGVGTRLHLRGPLGHGYALPSTARRVALIAFRCSARTVLSLLEPAFRQEASVTLVADHIPDDLPLQVEAQPPHALFDVCKWADYVAFDVSRDRLPEMKAQLQPMRLSLKSPAQALVRVPMPCGALAECGICTVPVGDSLRLACEDGPVFELNQLMGWASRA